jgi:glycine/D-amino acid oxidase-like deaminating enzyme
MRRGDVSFWYADMGGLPAPRAALAGDAAADVCIVGAGYTGLWAAYYLKKAQPDLNILIVEKAFAGFGASGRNGGWLSGGFAWNHDRYAATGGRQGVLDMVAAMGGTVDEVIRVCEQHGIEADIHRTDELMVAVNAAQLARLREEIVHKQAWGEGDRVREIGAVELATRVRIPGALGAMVLSGVARVQPAKLVQGLARVVEGQGVHIVEQTRVTGISKGLVTTNQGTIRAPIILRCTEGFTADLPGSHRDWVPLNSAQIVTPPLPDAFWEKVGWQGHEILGDYANSYSYCQRTREGRLTVGGRGIPYRLASRTDTGGAPDQGTIDWLKGKLAQLFPEAVPYGIDHAWCGVLGVPRDWCATVGLDPATGLGWAGGYVGIGVSTSNLAGRTLADLALGRTTPLTSLPWVNRRVRRYVSTAERR